MTAHSGRRVDACQAVYEDLLAGASG